MMKASDPLEMANDKASPMFSQTPDLRKFLGHNVDKEHPYGASWNPQVTETELRVWGAQGSWNT